MAEDFRQSDSTGTMTDPRTEELIAECQRQEESCRYTSTSLYIWLRQARLIRKIFVCVPMVLGALATWSILKQPENELLKWVIATFALLAGLFPAIFEALKLDTQIDEIKREAAAYKNLQDRFRISANVMSKEPFDDFKVDFDNLMDRMDQARLSSITPPERCFKAAQAKIQSGDYSFAADISSGIPPKSDS